jgi:group I intron endonuclease
MSIISIRSKMSQDFSKGKIYKITNDFNNEVYVGSTCDTVGRRFNKHKSDYKKETNMNTPLYKLMNEIGFERFRIQIIEEYPTEDKYQLRQREGYWIRQLGTLNIRIEDRTKKEWRDENKEKYKDYHKTHWQQYFEENKDEYNEKRRNDYSNRKSEIRIRMICECGTDVCKRDLAKHLKTQKHTKLLETKNN